MTPTDRELLPEAALLTLASMQAVMVSEIEAYRAARVAAVVKESLTAQRAITRAAGATVADKGE